MAEEKKVEKMEEKKIKEDVSKAPSKEKVGKVEEKKKVETKKVEKEIAVANGFALRISPKYAIAVCKIIRGKTPEAAIERLEAVVAEKRPVPMASMEVAHKKGKGLAGGKREWGI